MCPGRPPARSSTSRAASSTRSHGPSSTAGSRFPCTPRSCADLLPAAVERDPPVEADHVAAGVGHRAQERGGARAEVDRRHVDGGEDPRRVGRDELLVVGRRERPDPRVEQLDHVRPGLGLRGHVGREPVGEPVGERVPDVRLAVHQRLDPGEVAARLPLDEVAGDGERPAAEADHGLVVAQLAAHDPHRLEDPLVRRAGPEPLHVRGGADRLRHHRADPVHELDVDPHREDRGHDVREHHGRVDAVAAYRLERHLGAELRPLADLEERVALADRAVLRQRPPRLPHEPDRRPLDRFTARGADEKRFHAS